MSIKDIATTTLAKRKEKQEIDELENEMTKAFSEFINKDENKPRSTKRKSTKKSNQKLKRIKAIQIEGTTMLNPEFTLT